jgi:hypothetical protein
MCAQTKKTVFSLRELKDRLAHELELTQKDFHVRLILAAEKVPELVTIFPPGIG